MSSFFNFIKSVIEFATKFVSYLLTVPGILITSIIGIVTYLVNIIGQLSSQSSTLVQTANTFANSYNVNDMTQSVAGGFMELLCYASSVDILLDSIIAILSFFIFLILLVVFAYFYWLIPLLVTIIGVKILLALFRRFVPAGWLPDLSVDVPQLPWVVKGYEDPGDGAPF